MPTDILDDDETRDGLDEPLQEAGPQDCEPGAIECEEKASDDGESGPGVEVFARDEVAEQFPVETIPVGLSPDDGLPTPMDYFEPSVAVPFDYDHVICIEDAREYVEVFDGEGWPGGARSPRVLFATLEPRNFAEDEPRDPRFAPLRSRWTDSGEEILERRSFGPDKVVERWGLKFGESVGQLVLVRPRRETCKYYKRQVMPNDDKPKETDAGHRIVFRNCTIRKSVGGAFMSLRDEGVYGCDYRDPPDPESTEKALDGPDRDRIARATRGETAPLFNISPKPKDA